ncbi:MAG: ribosomal protein L7/L12 [Phycisphaeraceae bacterium JB051]
MADINEEQLKQVEELLFAGQTIQAIKLVREITGMGLKEAKEFVDQHYDHLREAYPDKLPEKKAGCGAASLIFLTASLSLVGMYLAS